MGMIGVLICEELRIR